MTGKRLRYSGLVLSILLSLPVPGGSAFAACATPYGVSGSINYDDAVRARTICDGSEWKTLEEIDYSSAAARRRLQIADDTGSCLPEKKGRLRFSDITGWAYCDGEDWLPFESAAGSSRGYLVQTQTRYRGNLGGLSGADAECLTELQSRDWKGKDAAGALTAGRVKAFLCDGTNCNNLMPDSFYIMAKAGNTSYGGAALLTDSSGRGPGFWQYLDENNWNADYGMWMNRGTLNDSYWDTTPLGNNHCSQWSATSGNGRAGNAGEPDERRWDNENNSCNSQNFLLCIVNP